MKIVDLFRLIRKHIVLLIAAPVFLAALVVLLTFKPNFRFSSQTTLFTGIATGSSVDMDKSFNYFITNTAFDNLINIVKSRNTQLEVAIRLLSQHLLLTKADPTYISPENLAELKKITPEYIYQYVVKSSDMSKSKISVSNTDSAKITLSVGADMANVQPEIPSYIDKDAYEKTVQNLTRLMASNDTNFVYKLLNYPNPHYSFKDISSVKVSRIGTSDMIQLSYETDDPGICQQTLALLVNACIRNYKIVKENRSDAVIRYFENQLALAADRLKLAEDKLLQFNKDNNIINYYEQSKAVAVVKEDLDVEYNKMRIKLAGVEAAIARLEEKLNVQEQIQLKSTKMVDLRNQLGSLNFRINTAETLRSAENEDFKNLADLKLEAQKLQDQLKESVSELYSFKNSKEGLPLSTILNDWIAQVIEAENLKAGIKVMGDRINEFQKQYAIYAPAGANIKRIEREISVSEEEFLEILHGLNLAKLKLQDNELAANIKVVDPPYFPLSPIPTKRKILVILAAMIGFVFILSAILFAEYFDETLKNPARAAKLLGREPLGVVPKILLRSPAVNPEKLTERLLGIGVQNIELALRPTDASKLSKTILIYSTQAKEGKTVVAGNLALQMKKLGKNVVYLNLVANDNSREVFQKRKIRKASVLNRLLGYPDERIDFDSQFLANPSDYLSDNEYYTFKVDEVVKCDSMDSFLVEKLTLIGKPDFILIEIPSVIHHSYPTRLLSDIDLPVLVCRSNRVWTSADQSAIETLDKLIGKTGFFVLNGVDLDAVESVLGELPKKRSKVRRAIKKLVQLQFLTRNQI
ncbi:MAG TPA: hypothetical protein DHV48_10895 [Prolixibacteraceae bacterium]|nr:hypothetical protein [Prolixibacteraceae bacterium]